MLPRRCLRDFPECFPTPSKQKLSSGMQRRRAQQRYKGCLEPNTESIGPHQRIRTWRDGPKTSRKQEHFPRNAAGQDRNITWPPRSPDLIPLDFYLWGHIKSLVYVKNYENLTDLKNSISAAFQEVTQETVSASIKNLEKRLKLVVENGGAHIEK